jgi:hypothetical protein
MAENLGIATRTVTQLPVADTLTGTEQVVLQQNGVTKQALVQTIRNYGSSQLVSGSRSSGAAVLSLITALQNLGLPLIDNTSA